MERRTYLVVRLATHVLGHSIADDEKTVQPHSIFEYMRVFSLRRRSGGLVGRAPSVTMLVQSRSPPILPLPSSGKPPSSSRRPRRLRSVPQSTCCFVHFTLRGDWALRSGSVLTVFCVYLLSRPSYRPLQRSTRGLRFAAHAYRGLANASRD